MTILTQALCDSFLLELATGVHVLGTDVLKLALYDSTASISYATTAYSASHEIAGAGYSAGGFTLALTATYPKIVSRKLLVDFADFVANPAAFTANYGLIYNSSKANRAVAALDFGGAIIATNSFTWTWPAPTADTATIRMAAAQ